MATDTDSFLRRRCAIYVRKSSASAASQDFTSLQAQREVCSAYITSQAHRGWTEVRACYEDDGVSGGTLERPAVQALIADVERGLIDIVVVYKLDRLSRSLLDFVRLLELFDRHSVSFVCITQNFDTGDALGRLVMNVLLTFAQFERELAGDRIRDKKRLMCARGMWSGGRPPLGYDLRCHKLVINREEAMLVRRIYSRYIRLRSMKAVTRKCRQKGERSKVRIDRRGRETGGQLLTIGTIRNILRNPIYKGEVRSGEVRHEGIHQPIVSEELWKQASTIREDQIKLRVTSAPEDLLGGVSFDCFGRRLKPDRRYLKNGWVALYTSFQTSWGREKNVKRLRMNAAGFEKVVLARIHNLLNDTSQLRAIIIENGEGALERAANGASVSRHLTAMPHHQLRSTLHAIVERIEVSRERILMQLRATDVVRLLDWDGVGSFARDPMRRTSRLLPINVPCLGIARLERKLRLPISTNAAESKPNARLVSLIREMRTAQALSEQYRTDSDAKLAERLNRSTGSFMRLLRLNYLAPDIVTAILDGTQPDGLRRRDLLNADLPLDWVLQRKLFGFQEQPMLQGPERY